MLKRKLYNASNERFSPVTTSTPEVAGLLAKVQTAQAHNSLQSSSADSNASPPASRAGASAQHTGPFTDTQLRSKRLGRYTSAEWEAGGGPDPSTVALSLLGMRHVEADDEVWR